MGKFVTLEMPSVEELIEQLGIGENGHVQEKYSEICKDDMEEYVPMLEGALREEAIIDKYNAQGVIYGPEGSNSNAYAGPQYFGMPGGHAAVNYTTEGTGPFWDEPAKMNKTEQRNDKIQKYIDKNVDVKI